MQRQQLAQPATPNLKGLLIAIAITAAISSAVTCSVTPHGGPCATWETTVSRTPNGTFNQTVCTSFR